MRKPVKVSDVMLLALHKTRELGRVRVIQTRLIHADKYTI